MVKSRDIAELAGGSEATVFRILNEDSTFTVKNETRELVKKVAKENNYKTKKERAMEELSIVVDFYQ